MSFKIQDKKASFQCPGCNGYTEIPVNDPNDQRSWTWNGDKDRPTLTEIILCSCGWHGYLTNGEFVFWWRVLLSM